MSSDAIPAVAAGTPSPAPTTADSTSANTADPSPRLSGLASLMVPVEPVRAGDFDLAPNADGAPADPATTPNGGDADKADHGSSTTYKNDDSSGNGKDGANGSGQPKSVFKAWMLAGAQRWAKGGGTANKRFEVAKARAATDKARATAQQTKTTETVNRSAGAGGLSGSGGTAASGKGADKGGSAKKSPASAKQTSGAGRGSTGNGSSGRAGGGSGGGRGTSGGGGTPGGGRKNAADKGGSAKPAPKDTKKDAKASAGPAGTGSGRGTDKGTGKGSDKADSKKKPDPSSANTSTPAQDRARRRQDRRDNGQDAKLQGRAERRNARLEKKNKDQDAGREVKYGSQKAQQDTKDKVRNAQIEADAGRKEQARQAKFEQKQQRAKERADAKRQKRADPPSPGPAKAPTSDPAKGPPAAPAPKKDDTAPKDKPVDLDKKPKRLPWRRTPKSPTNTHGPDDLNTPKTRGKDDPRKPDSPKTPGKPPEKQPIDLSKKPTPDPKDGNNKTPDPKNAPPGAAKPAPKTPAAKQPAPRSTQKAREAGYRHGTAVGDATAKAGAYRDGIKDGYRGRTEQGRREAQQMDAIHAQRKQHRQEQPVTVTSADYHPPTEPQKAQAIPASTHGGQVHLGPGSARPTIGYGEVRNMKQFQDKLGVQRYALQWIYEDLQMKNQRLQDLAKRSADLLERGRAIDVGEKSIGKAVKADERIAVLASITDGLLTRLARGLDEVEALNVNTETRYGLIYKAVLNSDEQAPARDLGYYVNQGG